MVPAVAGARLKPITGTLSRSGYTVIAFGTSGKPAAVVVKGRAFSLRPPTAAVTLQLRAPDGRYGGPIVVAGRRRGTQVIDGVKAGARLGKITIYAGKGYARVAKRLAARWLDTGRWARARKGVPIGNGRNTGFVRSKPPRHSPRGDRDADGVPDAIDVDINGNRVFNNIDGAIAARSAHAAQAGSGTFDYGLYLSTRLEDTANADAGSTPDQIAAALPAHGGVHLGIASGDSVELDCGGSPDRKSPTGWSGGLTWCTKGGTGTEGGQNRPEERPFPACCDPNGNGYGTMINNTGSPQSGPHMSLSTHAGADQIGTGDTLIERVTTGGVERQLVTTLQYSVATVPALVSYDDGQGDATTISYPVAGGGLAPGLGTVQNPFPVKANPSTGHVTLTVTLWRPQRKPIPPDANGAGGDACVSNSPSCRWIDIGGLNYMTTIESAGAMCPQSAYLGHDSNLFDGTDLPGTPGIRDRAADQPASPANTFAFALDLTTCATSPVRGDGSPTSPYSFAIGDTRNLGFQYRSASPQGGNVDGRQEMFFKRVS